MFSNYKEQFNGNKLILTSLSMCVDFNYILLYDHNIFLSTKNRLLTQTGIDIKSNNCYRAAIVVL